jgi:hypothetical protein
LGNTPRKATGIVVRDESFVSCPRKKQKRLS